MKYLSIIIIPNLLCNLLVVESLPDWKNFAQKLRDKLRTVLKRTISRSRESASVGSSMFSASDYPKNADALKEMDNLWRDYYKCLESKKANLKENPISSYAIAVFTGSFIQLDCNICVSPEDVLEDTEWYFVDKPYTSKTMAVKEDEHKQLSTFTFTLYLSDLQRIHQGMYFCRLKNNIDVPYFVHVLNSSDEPIAEVKPAEAKIGPYPQAPVQIKNSEISIWNNWTSWTECSICGKIGKRTRIGYCYVGLVQNLPNHIKTKLVSSEGITDISAEVLRETESLMKYFEHGIPCRSTLLPTEFYDHPIIKNFRTEIMAGFCKVSCPSSVIFEVVDKNGQVVDKANNSAKIYSAHQDLPPQLQTFQRITQNVKLGQYFILSCPSPLYKDTPVQWSVEDKIWIKENIEEISHKRIALNDLNEIVFTKVEDIDLNKNYSCYQFNESVGVVELKLELDPPISLSYSEKRKLFTIIMCFCIVSTFVWIPFRMYLIQEKATAGQVFPHPQKELSIKEFLIKMYHDSYIGK